MQNQYRQVVQQQQKPHKNGKSQRKLRQCPKGRDTPIVSSRRQTSADQICASAYACMYMCVCVRPHLFTYVSTYTCILKLQFFYELRHCNTLFAVCFSKWHVVVLIVVSIWNICCATLICLPQ